MPVEIKPVNERMLDIILDLFGQYQVFYKTMPDRKKNEKFLKALLQTSQEAAQFLAFEQDQAVGFATIYYTYSSVSAERTGTLNDLYVAPVARGKGVGRALMDHCAAFLRAQGIAKMVWMTHVSNRTAQRLYDTYPTQRDTWYEYTLAL